MNVETYREHAAECLRQAEAEAAPEDKNILLNVALVQVDRRTFDLPAVSDETRPQHR